MIKTGILGGESWQAGELIRILIHHPEVELISVCAPRLKGLPVSSVHAGLIGDTKLIFSDAVDVNNIDVLFVAGNEHEGELKNFLSLNPDLKVIYLTPSFKASPESGLFDMHPVPAISELFRKPLVRGARAAATFDPALTVMLILLGPLAAHLILTDDIKVRITVNSSQDELLRTESFLSSAIEILKKIQKSFPGNITLEQIATSRPRRLSVAIETENTIPLHEIEKFYDNIYDDHNFTYVIDRPVKPSEVTGSHKCIIHISKPDEKILRIEGEADSLMRGGAGDAVHAMNLMFGLYEKIGLNLKTITIPE